MATESALKRKIKNCKEYENPASNVVKISVKDAGEIISPFAENQQAIISSDFAHFLENSVKDVSVKQDLTIEISAKIWGSVTGDEIPPANPAASSAAIAAVVSY